MKTTKFVVAGALCAWILMTAQVLAAQTSQRQLDADALGVARQGELRAGLPPRPQQHEPPVGLARTTRFRDSTSRQRGKRDVQFAVAREAGRFDCEGYLNNGVGAGVFLFTPDAKFAKAMSDLGFDGIDEPMQFAMATIDVSSEFAQPDEGREILRPHHGQAASALRIFDVNPQYLREMRNEGLPMTEVDKVIAFRVHGIEASRVRECKKLGIRADENQLVALQVHGATPSG